jgi:hypothetical protein
MIHSTRVIRLVMAVVAELMHRRAEMQRITDAESLRVELLLMAEQTLAVPERSVRFDLLVRIEPLKRLNRMADEARRFDVSPTRPKKQAI